MATQWWTRQQLKSRNAATRRQALTKLAADENALGIEQLQPLLEDPEVEIRVAAVKALGAIAGDDARKLLLNALQSRDGDVREAAAATLAQVADPCAIDPLVNALRDARVAVRWHAARALDAVGWQPATDAQQVLRHVALSEFHKAARLGAVAVEPLMNVLRDEYCSDRRAVVEALSQIGDARTVKALLVALKDADSHVRVAAVEALSAVRDARAIEGVALTLRDKDHRVRAAAANALGKSADPSAVERLKLPLKDAHWEVRRAAVGALGRLKDARAVEPLAGMLHDADHDVRESATEALGVLGDPRAIEFLVVALTDSQTAVRKLAGGALRKIDYAWEKSEEAKRAIPQLKVALKDREYWVRQSAADVLARIGNIRAAESEISGFSNAVNYQHQAAVDALLEILEDCDRDLRLAAVEALGRVRDPRTIKALSSTLNDEDPWVRAASTQALEILGWQPAHCDEHEPPAREFDTQVFERTEASQLRR